MGDRVVVGLMGLGVVGSGVAGILANKAANIAGQVGGPVALKRVLVRDLKKPRTTPVPSGSLTTDPRDLLDDAEIDIVIELLGGEHPAYELMREALTRGKHVITANKEVIAKHGPELLALADANRVAIRYEASVGGGIPLIAPFRQSLLANDISAVHAIINGTTNYILTRMGRDDLDLPEALAEAQALGYAEPDPSNDVDGTDAAYKLAILASLAFHTTVRPDNVYREGIRRLTARDFRYARELGYAIKLLAIAKQDGGELEVRVHPTMLPAGHILAGVDGVFNAVEVEGDLTGRIMFYGRGAGSLPTTSAVIADLIELAREVHQGADRVRMVSAEGGLSIRSIEATRTRYYVRMSVPDRPGVLAQLTRVLGDLGISIASVIQKEVDEAAQTAEIVLMTHIAPEHAMRRAIHEMAAILPAGDIGTAVRVEG